MSTIVSIPAAFEADHRQQLLDELEGDAHLQLGDRLEERLAALDLLDAHFGGLASTADDNAPILLRVEKLRLRLEAANNAVYDALREELISGKTKSFLQRLQTLGSRSGEVVAGMGFDVLDEVVSGVLQLREPDEAHPLASAEMVPYQPTPVRHLLDLLAGGTLASNDVFVDLGSGMGHVPLLVSMLTGVTSIGYEIEPAYVASAQECAARLGVRRARFAAQDVREAELSRGTFFYLYSSFKGSILDEVLERLREEATRRPLRFCSLGPSTLALETRRWLRPHPPARAGRMTVFSLR